MVATVTLDACIVQTEQKTPRLRNFERAARRAGEPHEGITWANRANFDMQVWLPTRIDGVKIES